MYIYIYKCHACPSSYMKHMACTWVSLLWSIQEEEEGEGEEEGEDKDKEEKEGEEEEEEENKLFLKCV